MSRHLEQIRAAVDAYQGRLIAFASRITGDVDSARDVVQDTFLRLCHQDLEEIGDYLAAWLFRVCRNRALDVQKKEAPLRPLDEATAAGTVVHDAVRLLEDADEARRVLAAVSSLSASQQEVLRLRFNDGLSYKEISAITGHSVSNVGFLVHAAIKKLRVRLETAAMAQTGEARSND